MDSEQKQRPTFITSVIAQLNDHGYTVKVKHERASVESVERALRQRASGTPLAMPVTLHKSDLLKAGVEISPFAGRTIVRIFKGEDVLVAAADAICAPIDQFDKRRGTAKALGRAVGRFHRTVRDVKINTGKKR